MRRSYFRAVAIDFDGTLTETGRLAPEVIAAITRARSAGIEIVIATGRILSELLEVEPDVHDVVSTIVCENGCVVVRGGVARALVRPVDLRLDRLLVERGVAFRRGQVLLACAAADEPLVLDATRELGEEHQLVRNRSELMIVPEGVTKGTGVQAALDDLGLSAHSTIGVGDAENDHSLFEVCELGVAVANAVEGLARHADIVLTEPNGAGIVSLLDGGLVSGRLAHPPTRWSIDLGRDAADAPVSLPASQLNVLVAGGSGSGKSYCAGLMAEQLIRQGYSVLVVDPEGDHRDLGVLPHVTVIGVDDVMVDPASLVQMLGQPGASIVVDLSGMTPADQEEYLYAIPAEIESQRARSGLPHWVLSDEAQRTLGLTEHRLGAFDTSVKGHLLVTWRPEDLRPDVLASIDVAIVLRGAGPTRPPGDDEAETEVTEIADAAAIEVAAAVGAVAQAEVAAALDGASHGVIMTSRDRPGEVVTIDLAQREVRHVRHEHKYELVGVAPADRFFFWDPPDEARRAAASNLDELRHELSACPASVVIHHGRRHDFSRWIDEVLKERRLAGLVSMVEDEMRDEVDPEHAESARRTLVRVLRHHP